MKRAYSVLEVKAVNEDERVIEGIASTPTPDRVGDVVVPTGAKFALPMPLLWQHNHAQPVGTVEFAEPNERGIPFRARLPKIDEAGILKDRVDEAWQSVKAKLVRGVSIGFQALKDGVELMKDGGYKFNKWEWLELSLVTIPANADATIQTIKAIDQQLRHGASAEKTVLPIVRLSDPGVSGNTARDRESDMKTIKEQIAAFEAKRLANVSRMEEITNKAAEEARSKDEDEREEFNTLRDEVKSIDTELTDLREMEKLAVSKATAVPIKPGEKEAEAARAGLQAIQLDEKLQPGIEFARFAMCVGVAKGNLHQAYEIAKNRFANSGRLHTVLKAAVAAGTTTDATWALPLVEYTQFAGDFVEYLRPRTIIGRFGNGGIPSLRQIPFNVHIRGQTSGGEGYWVGQGAPKPLTKFDFNDTYLGYAKVANIAVLTEELMRFSNPSAERLVRDALAEAIIARMDVDFVDPNKAEVANVSPASITNGVTQIQSAGTDADAVRTDVQAAMSTYIAANITPTSGVWIMDATTALALSLMRNSLGQKEFPDITMTGGTFEGLPVIVSEHVPTDSDGHFLILANASDIWLADDGMVVIDASREASLQMLDDPTNNSATPTATTMVSMFQTNSVALRAERWINWKKRRAAAVAVVAGVNYSPSAA